ncbi:MAG TPA: DEAD/DEAH box helicase, partial [Bacteroidales bacterium]|nr:DEAD/DEAH box helicase [Bacteroidales bacterium]
MYRESFENSSRPRAGRNQRKSSPAPASNGRRNAGGGYKPSTLDPQLLVRKAELVEAIDYLSERRIDELPVHPELRKRLMDKGYERPTEIQDRTLETLLQGRDLLGIAQTGTGKTAAFMVPVIESLMKQKRNHYALVLVPTRELAVQVEDEYRSMVKGLGLYSHCFIGGTNINTDLSRLNRPAHVIIATPGRLLDLAGRNALSLNAFHTLILDEFDRML